MRRTSGGEAASGGGERGRKITLGHRVEALLVGGVGLCIRVLPERIALSMG